jgi:hypothetical protein
MFITCSSQSLDDHRGKSPLTVKRKGSGSKGSGSDGEETVFEHFAVLVGWLELGFERKLLGFTLSVL